MRNILLVICLILPSWLWAQLSGHNPKSRSRGIAQTVITRYSSVVTIPFLMKDIERAPLKFLSGMQYIPGMGIVFTNWTGHVKEKVPYIYWVDWNKNVIDTFNPCVGIESVSSVFIPMKNEKVYH